MTKNKQWRDGRLTLWLVALLVILFVGSLFLLRELRRTGQIPWRLPVWLGGKPETLAAKSLKLEETLNRVLTENGVNDRDLVAVSTSEKTAGETSWYFFEKQIKLPEQVDIRALQSHLSQAVSKQNARTLVNQLENKSEENILTFKAGFKNRVTHFLIIGQLLSAKPQNRGPQVALIIDDVGNNEDVKLLDELSIPVTVAILPRLSYSAYSVNHALKKKYVPILHLPLEPLETDKKPGPGVITTSMSEKEILATLDADLKSVPGVLGVNTHMGSLATQDKRVLTVILEELKKRDLFFVDSLVVKNSLGNKVAHEVGISYLERDVFIDNLDEVSYVKNQLQELIEVAIKKGRAIGIGHIYHESTRTAIKEMLPVFEEKQVTFVLITDFLSGKGAELADPGN